ncbi:MAG: hypothetical protein ACOYN0_10280 [Phycisphaerales bacterium]
MNSGTHATATIPPAPRWVFDLVGAPLPGELIRIGDRVCEAGTAAIDDATFVCLRLPGADALNAADLRLAVVEMYRLIFSTLEAERRHPVRAWHAIPSIHQPMGDELDRYRVFNIGRFDAFVERFGDPSSFGRTLFAASAVGHGGDDLTISVLATRERGRPMENPLQTPAFGYSRAYGPRPPCFARATLARIAGAPKLLVSGTASIRGEDSTNPGSLESQTNETLENIGVLAAAFGEPYSLSGCDTARVYLPRPEDSPWIAEFLSARLPAAAEIECCHADVCRPELLVEIEVTILPHRP